MGFVWTRPITDKTSNFKRKAFNDGSCLDKTHYGQYNTPNQKARKDGSCPVKSSHGKYTALVIPEIIQEYIQKKFKNLANSKSCDVTTVQAICKECGVGILAFVSTLSRPLKWRSGPSGSVNAQNHQILRDFQVIRLSVEWEHNSLIKRHACPVCENKTWHFAQLQEQCMERPKQARINACRVDSWCFELCKTCRATHISPCKDSNRRCEEAQSDVVQMLEEERKVNSYTNKSWMIFLLRPFDK